ncbi:hypothetical protein CBW65_07715 [Tumebacillus avium]|uniref:Uncharacterized protein n=1 Tax=Tumebacillus avium TaxID=1903704 RepID=A0A1Y0IN89_9BACL|nr:hypothetical protein [Tumebacillus avium]ARU60985.1 hypothetical protein CBW65_07715 [Tumebacillus avium]
MKKQAVALLMSAALVSTFATNAAFAKAPDRQVGSYSQTTPTIQPEDSFTVYEANGFISNTAYGVASYVDTKYHLNHRADITVPSGVTATYEFSQTIQQTSTRQHTWSGGISGSMTIAQIANVDAFVSYNYVSSTTMTYSKGYKSNLNVSSPGTYTAYWYNEAQVYNIYGKWWGYTYDAPSTRKQLTRYLSDVKEPKQWENIEVIKK